MGYPSDLGGTPWGTPWGSLGGTPLGTPRGPYPKGRNGPPCNFRALKNIFFGVLLLTLSGCVMDIRDYVGSGRGILGVSGKKTKKI